MINNNTNDIEFILSLIDMAITSGNARIMLSDNECLGIAIPLDSDVRWKEVINNHFAERQGKGTINPFIPSHNLYGNPS